MRGVKEGKSPNQWKNTHWLIDSFKERIARFDKETLVQQWYADVRFSEFGFDYGGMAGASSSHPPSFDSPPPANPQNIEESEDEDDDDEWSL
jgi:hypothetical protein